MFERQYRKNVGAVVRGLLNGVKHTPQTIGSVLAIDSDKLDKIIRGEMELTEDIEKALASFPGINQRDFYSAESHNFFPIVDDTDDGVVVFSAQDTFRSRRILTRGSENTPYYIYADTAMSNVSSFRPEWIKELYAHDGENADDLPDWTFNKGHFEHQVTYFIGPVNFYWIDKTGKRHVRKMDTGDTNYITPFVPHTFTTRVKDQGLILAVTYGGAISNPEFRSKISSLGLDDYLKNTKVRLSNYKFATDLDLLGGVGILKYISAKRGIDVVNLIHSNCQPDTIVRESIILPNSEEVEYYSTSSDRWGYNIGNSDVVLEWSNKKMHKLKPGDSFFIRPETPHTFKKAVVVACSGGTLLVIDIKPQSGDSDAELALIETYVGDVGLKRVHTETTRWY